MPKFVQNSLTGAKDTLELAGQQSLFAAQFLKTYQSESATDHITTKWTHNTFLCAIYQYIFSWKRRFVTFTVSVSSVKASKSSFSDMPNFTKKFKAIISFHSLALAQKLSMKNLSEVLHAGAMKSVMLPCHLPNYHYCKF